MMKLLLAVFFSLTTLASAHYTFPSLVVNGQTTPAWQYVRRTNNFQSNGPVTDVRSQDFRCYNSQTGATAQTYKGVTPGSKIGFATSAGISHPSTTNIYMAKAPSGVDVASWDGSGAVWFKVYEISAVTNGGSSITFPSAGLQSVTFNLPQSIPSGQYLVRIENVALHSASGVGGGTNVLSIPYFSPTTLKTSINFIISLYSSMVHQLRTDRSHKRRKRYPKTFGVYPWCLHRNRTWHRAQHLLPYSQDLRPARSCRLEWINAKMSHGSFDMVHWHYILLSIPMQTSTVLP